ncbi:PREDICTED: ankyrin repeat-containing protein At5g02620-like [Tarenaya hassleriana]|uniref:ankyrin repeat-containing protein At5g02620-like n=1 Tax=Tarenaya hassleriana TaxID=28532 RepID=UPI00053C5D28|nr:PREDICTED: ankyrin repeat-containing protein At5g02620-like [Tarenaya hassleriana]
MEIILVVSLSLSLHRRSVPRSHIILFQLLPMEEASTSGKAASVRKKMAKQLTGKREDSPLHSAVRRGDLTAVKEILSETGEDEDRLRELLQKQNQSGETALYAAAEYGDSDVVGELIKHYDLADAETKARNGFDPFHIAAKQGELGKLSSSTDPTRLCELAMTVDPSNTTALHTAAAQGHVEVVEYLIEAAGSSLAAIAKSNGKTALHSAARNGHARVVKAVVVAEPDTATRTDKKGQTPLHMAVKGQSLDVVIELMKGGRSALNMVDSKGNTPLHVASRKGRTQIVELLLENKGTSTRAINRAGETALDTAEKTGHEEVAVVLRNHGVPSAKSIKNHAPAANEAARELKQTVSDIKHEVHHQLEHARETRKRVQGIAKRINKMHVEGLNNAINSTTVVAVLIATVAFAAIFTVPGQYVDDPSSVLWGQSLGEANIAGRPAFTIFFVFDSIALFISLGVVVVQTSVVAIEHNAKKNMMAVINKLMWLACVLISVAFLALAFVVVGEEERWLAVGVTVVGASIMLTTLGTMGYWVVRHRIEASNARNEQRESMSRSRQLTGLIEFSGILSKRMYAI